MTRGLLMMCIGLGLGIAGMAIAHDDETNANHVKVLSAEDIQERINDKDSKVTVVEVTLTPGQAGAPHRHPGPVFGYIAEGEYEWAIDQQPARVLKTGETFYEPTGCLHRVSKNPAAKGKTRVIAVLIHPRDVQELAIPEPETK